MDRISLLDDFKHMYDKFLDPNIREVNMLKETHMVYLELIKAPNENDLVIYKYALKDWDAGPVYSGEEMGISDRNDHSHEAEEFAHLSLANMF